MKNSIQHPKKQASAIQEGKIAEIIQQACNKIAPFWSLENFVAVNPYLGLSHFSFEDAASRMAKTASVEMTMPLSFYLEQVDSGQITTDNVEKALNKANKTTVPGAEKFINRLRHENKQSDQKQSISLVTDIATKTTRKNWNELLKDRITSWASIYFDKGQASWKAVNQEQNLYAAWREYAITDATPRIMGLKSFRDTIEKLPENSMDAKQVCIQQLKIPEEALEHYLHALLLRMGGWSAYIAGIDWDNQLYFEKTENVSDFLTILLCWEMAMLNFLKEKKLDNHWYKAAYELPEFLDNDEDNDLTDRLILHQAFEYANQEKLIALFNSKENDRNNAKTTPLVQAIFCIDVRSEVYRRNLEMIAPEVETIGFAGFFGFPIKYVPLAHNHGQNQCPALIPSAVTIKEVVKDTHQNRKAEHARKLSHHLAKTWKSFKHGAISNFSFVSPLGLTYLPKIFMDAFGLSRPVPHPEKYGLSGKVAKNLTVSIEAEKHNHETTGIPFHEQVKMAKSALNGMSLTSGFARLVLIAGHGSSTVNNPHASGLDCGACGGHAGDANAQVAAKVLNHPKVREELGKQGITIPNDTHFLAALHDTTTDIVEVLNEDTVPATHLDDLQQLKKWLASAGQAARTERAARFHLGNNQNATSELLKRSRDWSQVRPEWGLAGCHTFVVAPRERTSDLNLDGKSFLHNYDWKKDEGFSVLELIMTAPMVVTSWINLQYFASTVDNKNFGAGNKTLHNVTAGIGVLEGYSGDLRIGLPWQSVHDGEHFQHLPFRLNVIVEAPLEAMNAVLTKHSNVKNLCDNGWIQLMDINDEGKVSHRYAGENEWEPLTEIEEEVLVK